MAKVVIHLKSNHMDKDFAAAHLKLYGIIEAMGRRHGFEVVRRLRAADLRDGTRSVTDNRFDDGDLHILDDRSVRAPNVLNASLAYFKGYWHLDPQGTRAFSSIGAMTYDPSEVPFRPAKAFFDQMRQRLVATRRSRYPQPETASDVPDGAVAVFFQGDLPRASGTTDFGDLDMLRAVMAGAGDRPIVVKPHPQLDMTKERDALHEIAAQDARVQISDANVHDILRASCVSVSINSTVALEGFLHRVPAVLFGTSDFHHYAQTVERPGQFKQALNKSQKRSGGYAQYLYWYFKRHCLHVQDDHLSGRVLHRFAAAGFPLEKLVNSAD